MYLRSAGAFMMASCTRSERMMPLSGRYALFTPLANDTISGSTFQWSRANHLPVRQKPVMISSAISSTSYRSQISRTLGKYEAGGTITPPAPMTGSAMIAATVLGPAIGIRRRNLHEMRHERREHLVIRRHAGRAGRRHRDAVVGVHTRDKLHLVGPAMDLPVEPRRLERRLVRLCAAGREVHRAHVRVGEADQPRGEVNRGHICRPDVIGHEGELLHLLRRRLSQLAPAVPHVDVPEARQAVDVLLAFYVGQAGPAPPDEDNRVLV